MEKQMNINEQILEIIKAESDSANVRKYTCINGAGYSQFERNIADRAIEVTAMTNKGNKLTQEILKSLGFKQEITTDDDDDEIKTWYKNGISIHEDSWWIKDGVSCYEPGEKEPEITFSFATNTREDGSMKSGFMIDTDTQLSNLYFSLTNTLLKQRTQE